MQEGGLEKNFCLSYMELVDPVFVKHVDSVCSYEKQEPNHKNQR